MKTNSCADTSTHTLTYTHKYACTRAIPFSLYLSPSISFSRTHKRVHLQYSFLNTSLNSISLTTRSLCLLLSIPLSLSPYQYQYLLFFLISFISILFLAYLCGLVRHRHQARRNDRGLPVVYLQGSYQFPSFLFPC